MEKIKNLKNQSHSDIGNPYLDCDLVSEDQITNHIGDTKTQSQGNQQNNTCKMICSNKGY